MYPVNGKDSGASGEINKYIDNFEMIEFNMDKIMNYWYNSDRKKVNEYKHLIMLDLDEKDLAKLASDGKTSGNMSR